MSGSKNNGQFNFNSDNEVVINEKYGDMTREPWLMLLAGRNKKPVDTLCWGMTNNGTSFARIGTQEGDILNGFVHEDPYKTRMLGTYAYFRTEDGKYFSNAWYPVLNKEQALETTFGFGYLKFKTAYNNFDMESLHFVPNDYDAMIQIIKIKNNGSETRKVTMFNVNPVNIGDARDIQFSGFNTLMMGGAIIDKTLNAIVWRNAFGRDFDSDGEKVKYMFGKVLVHTNSLPGNQFATRYDEFVGHHSNTMGNPAAVTEDWDLPCRDAHENCSSLSALKNSFTLKAGETKEIVVISAAPSTEDYYVDGKKSIKAFLEKALNPENAKKMLDEVKKEWAAELGKLSVKVDGTDEILNPSYKWLQYQCAMVALLNRMKSRFHSGFEYGYGFRDILQDILALLPYDPKPAKELIKFTAQQMFSDGFVYHNFYVKAAGNKDFVTCDDPLWLIYAVAEYIKESGDFDFLNEVVPYCDEKEELPAKEGTILEHLKIAIEKVWKQSDNGLPYMLMADWNDDLSGNFTSISTMAAQQLNKALIDMAELLNAKGIEKELAADYAKKAQIVKDEVEKRCIDKDGNYIRAVASKDFKAVLKKLTFGNTGLETDYLLEEMEESGAPVDLGSSKTDGLTFFEPIAWAGFSGIADKARFDACKKVCERDLDDKYGIAICQGDKTMSQGKLPTDTQGWKRNAPGKKENGGEFRHLESWYIASLCIFGYGKEAHDIYIKTLPAVASKDDPHLYAAERFVYPEYVSGPASNDHGKAGHTWLTGTAPTRLNVLIDWIFGVRRKYDGLLIDPCVSPEWKKFSAVRTFRNTTFNISFTNPNGVQKGVKSIKVNGKEIEGNTIALSYASGGKVDVEVVMG
uniref:Cellobiose phosphorylase n=1 Tax=uncultured bacterium contig00064 TaxID=1181547 RepID=A0A806JZM2_9BACT|nr:cellobiose phosphorylase [uncultured bacterium contig00064]